MHTENGRGCIHVLKKDRRDFTVLGYSSSLIRQDGQWFLRLPKALHCDRRNPLRENMTVMIMDRASGGWAELYAVPLPAHFSRYIHFCLPGQPFTIGASLEDDICLDLPASVSGAWTIDPKAHRIRRNGGPKNGLLNGEIIEEETSFGQGDCFECLNLRIIFQETSFMINGPFPMKETLIRDRPLPASLVIPPREEIMCTRDMPEIQLPLLACRLKLPQLSDDAFTSQLFLSMAPALMMASASLTAGSLNAYRAYMSGRSFLEIFPGILLPAVMLLSALLWNPLQRRYEKKQRRKKRNAVLAVFRRETEVFCEEIRKKNDAVSSYARMAALLPETCSPEYLQSHPAAVHDDGPVLLYLGKGRNLFQITYEQPLASEEEDLQKITAMIDETLKGLTGTAVLRDLWEYRRIVIENDDGRLFDLSLAALRYLYPFLRICIYCSREEAETDMKLREAAGRSKNGIRMICTEKEELLYLLDAEDGDTTVIVMRHPQGFMPEGYEAPVLCFEERPGRHRCDMRILCRGENLQISDLKRHKSFETVLKEPEDCSLLMHLHAPYADQRLPASRNGGFLAMNRAESTAALRIEEAWQTNDCRDELQCVIGLDNESRQIMLDLDERGQGPHGLIGGTTGSGKSELLLSMIMSLAVRYSPRRLQFVVIDFKGGTSFQSIMQEGMRLPHMKALLCDLDADDMKRALFCLKDILRQREICFREMSTRCRMPVRSLKDYRHLYKKDTELPELADMILIVDEFAELKRERPDFLDELVRIARLGRSLGLHLLLSTQKPGGVVTDQIWSNTGFRICLKVAEKQDSTEMIHCPDAVYLQDPGSFILQSDETMVTGRCGYLHQPLQNEKKQTAVLDARGRTVCCTRSETEITRTEFTDVLQAVYDCCPQGCGDMWLKVLPDLHAGREYWENGLLALLDDYKNQRYGPLPALRQKTEFHAVLSADTEETASFVCALVYALMTSGIHCDEFYMISDLRIPALRNLEEKGVFCGCPTTAETEKIRNLFRRLLNDDGKRRCLIIADLSHLYQSGDFCREMLRQLLQSGGRHRTDLWLIMRSSSVMNYQEQSLMTDFWCLRSENRNEIQNFMQASWKEKLQKNHHGIYRRDEILDFAWFQADAGQLKTMIEEYEMPEDIYRLPYMKECLLPSDCTMEGIPVGMLYRNYEWYTASEHLVVAAEFEDELETAEMYLKDCSGVSFLTLAEYRRTSAASFRRKDVLMIGEAAREEARMRGLVPVPGSEDGILIRKTRREVIHLVRMETNQDLY